MKSNVRFITGFGPVVRDREASRRLYAEDLGLSFDEEEGGYLHTEKIEGAKTFALWPLAQAARSCFGTDTWPSHVPIPQAWLLGLNAASDVNRKATGGSQIHG